MNDVFSTTPELVESSLQFQLENLKFPFVGMVSTKNPIIISHLHSTATNRYSEITISLSCVPSRWKFLEKDKLTL